MCANEYKYNNVEGERRMLKFLFLINNYDTKTIVRLKLRQMGKITGN
jgi:hypothetical protein